MEVVCMAYDSTARFHRVVFLRDGRETSLTFLGQVQAWKFMRTLHTTRRGRMEPVPALEGLLCQELASDRPFGSTLQLPAGPKQRIWGPRKPKTTRAFPNFTGSVQRWPRSSAGFGHVGSRPDTGVDGSTRTKVLRYHLGPDEASAWAQERYEERADGEWR